MRLCRPAVLFFAALLLAPRIGMAQRPDAPLRDGDRVLIKLWMDSLFADTVRVQEHGWIVAPRLGMVSIETVPARLLADSLRRAYARLFRDPSVEISPLRRVIVLGEVRRPATYFMEAHSTLRDAVAMAEGITDIGKQKRITVIRDSTRTKISGWESASGDDAVLRSGDVIVVERESWFSRNVFTIVSGTSVLLSIIVTLDRL